jgi:hypothetical protein
MEVTYEEGSKATTHNTQNCNYRQRAMYYISCIYTNTFCDILKVLDEAHNKVYIMPYNKRHSPIILKL